MNSQGGNGHTHRPNRNSRFPEFPVQRPSHLVVFSPHPDDVAISVGALTILAGRLQIPTTVVQVTDGAEARIPDELLFKHGWNPEWPPERSSRLRGFIRTAEAREELERLGLSAHTLTILEKQTWNTDQQTPSKAIHIDGSIKDVSQFKPGPIEPQAIAEIRRAISGQTTGFTICAIPEPDDRQGMHRMTTAVVLSALIDLAVEGQSCCLGLLAYSCLSTESRSPQMQSLQLCFGDEVMSQKCHAIRAHISMFERRRILGGYSNVGREPYDGLTRRWNRNISSRTGCIEPYAETYGWLERPSVGLLEELRSSALQCLD